MPIVVSDNLKTLVVPRETPAIPQTPYMETDRSQNNYNIDNILTGITAVEASGNKDYWGFTTSGTKFDTAFGPQQLTKTRLDDYMARNPKGIFNEDELAWMGNFSKILQKASGVADKKWRANPDINWTDKDKNYYNSVVKKMMTHDIDTWGVEGAIKRWHGNKDKKVNQSYFEKVSSNIPKEDRQPPKNFTNFSVMRVPKDKDESYIERFKSWVGSLTASTAEAEDLKQSKPSNIREPYKGELDYFKKNPNVAGMATEDNKVILNPYSKLSEKEKQSVIVNETARIKMRSKEFEPTFELTKEQIKYLDSTSYKDASDKDRKATIAARILSGDPSAGKPTAEQLKFVETLKD